MSTPATELPLVEKIPADSEKDISPDSETTKVFADLAGEFEIDDGDFREIPFVKIEEVPPVKPASPEALKIPGTPPPVISDEPVKVTPSVEEPSPQLTTTPAKTSEEITNEWKNWRTEQEGKLASEFYKIPDAEIEDYQADPGSYLPKLLAKVHMTVQEATMKSIVQLLPQLLQQQQVNSVADVEAENKFFAMFPDLKGRRGELEADAIKIANQYKNSNPNLEQEALMQYVGATLHVMHKIPMSGMPVVGESTQGLPSARPPGGAAMAAPNPGSKTDMSWQEELYKDIVNDD